MAHDTHTAIEVETPSREYDRYCQAVDRTHALIDLEPIRSPGLDAARARAEERMERLRALLDAFGNPHERIPLVHVAGTSGKGSTATAIAAGLTHAGYRTALHTSPYLQSATEKLQLDGRLIGGDELAELVDSTLAHAERLPAFATNPVSYGELWMAMALRWIAESGAEVGVVETGAGGRFDLSNVITPVISVITTIGFDHLETLGPTLADIAWHKAGIIKPGAPVVTGVRDPIAIEVIGREAEQTDSRLILPDSRDGKNGFAPTVAATPMPLFHRDNQVLAAAALRELGSLGFKVSPDAIDRGVGAIRLPGRAEIMQQEPLVLIDGAHNPQKMASLAAALRDWLPDSVEGRRSIVFGALESKSYREMIEHITLFADRLIVTAPDIYGKQGADPAAIAAEVANGGFPGAIDVVPDVADAVDAAFVDSGSADAVVITGSMYVAGNARERWYSTRAIVEERTPWPANGSVNGASQG